jgi:pyridinium-3,5-biscarboxylic acid mononucleotide synthase
VPTSAGYGASLEGLTALLGMLASCAAGLTVVGIDNGFGAASAICRLFPVVEPAPSPGPSPSAGPSPDRDAVEDPSEAVR